MAANALEALTGATPSFFLVSTAMNPDEVFEKLKLVNEARWWRSRSLKIPASTARWLITPTRCWAPSSATAKSTSKFATPGVSTSPAAAATTAFFCAHRPISQGLLHRRPGRAAGAMSKLFAFSAKKLSQGEAR